MHGRSDERCEYLIKDRLSFMRFLGLGLGDPAAGRQHDPDVPPSGFWEASNFLAETRRVRSLTDVAWARPINP